MHEMFDAAFPPQAAPAGYKVAAGYLGDPNYTPHVWTASQWARLNGYRKLPIWTWNPHRDPAEQAGMCLEQLLRLGFTSHVTRFGARLRTVVAVDLEALVIPAPLTEFATILGMAKYLVMPYGQGSTVFGNPACAGYWVADWAGVGPFMYSHPQVLATQWTNGDQYDSSLIRYRLYRRLH